MGRLQTNLYQAVALIVSEDIDKGASVLAAMDKAKLGEEEAELISAAELVAAEIRHEASPADVPTPAKSDDLAKTFKVVGTARTAMARAEESDQGSRQMTSVEVCRSARHAGRWFRQGKRASGVRWRLR